MPIENSSTGAIRQVYELLGRYECYIVGENCQGRALPDGSPMGLPWIPSPMSIPTEQGALPVQPSLAPHPGWVGVATGTRQTCSVCGPDQGISPRRPSVPAGRRSYMAWRFWPGSQLPTATTPPASWWSPPVMELREGADKISAVLSLPTRWAASMRYSPSLPSTG